MVLLLILLDQLCLVGILELDLVDELVAAEAIPQQEDEDVEDDEDGEGDADDGGHVVVGPLLPAVVLEVGEVLPEAVVAEGLDGEVVEHEEGLLVEDRVDDQILAWKFMGETKEMMMSGLIIYVPSLQMGKESEIFRSLEV